MKNVLILILLLTFSASSQNNYHDEYIDYCNTYNIHLPDSISFVGISYKPLNDMFDMRPVLIQEQWITPIMKGVTIVSDLDSVIYTEVFINSNIIDTNIQRLTAYHELSHALFLEPHSDSLILMTPAYFSTDTIDDCYVETAIQEYLNWKAKHQ